MHNLLEHLIPTQASVSTWTSWTCDACGEAIVSELEILGKLRRVPVECRCRRQEALNRQAEVERQGKLKRIQRLKKYSLMDAGFHQSTLANWDDTLGSPKLKKTVTRYVEAWPEMKRCNVGLLIHGDPGLGKTYAAFAVANELIQRHQAVVIAVNAIGLLSRIRETYSRYGQEAEIDIIRTLENASLLIIDDLGAEQKTDWAAAMLYQIIDSRYRGGKPLFITTNLTLDQLQEKLTTADGVNRTYDRIVEVCLPVKITGSSNRAAMAKDKRQQLVDLLRKEA